MKKNCLLTDMKRVLLAPVSWGAVVAVVITLFVSLESGGLRENVLKTWFYAVYLSGFTLTLVCCMLPYAFVFCEDMEHAYARYQIIRGGLGRYVISKVAVIYLSAVATMVLGGVLFVLLCSIWRPWGSANLEEASLMGSGAYTFFIEKGWIPGYCAVYALQLGFMAGFFAVFAAFVSLFLSNKVMVAALPVCLYQIWAETSRTVWFSVYTFHAYNRLFPKDWQCLLYAFAITAVPVGLLTVGIKKKLERRL